MARKPNVIPSSVINITLPFPERSQLDFYLYSELEERIPIGAYKEFFSARIREFFNQKTLDLAPYVGSGPGTMIIRGDEEAILALKKRLET